MRARARETHAKKEREKEAATAKARQEAAEYYEAEAAAWLLESDLPYEGKVDPTPFSPRHLDSIEGGRDRELYSYSGAKTSVSFSRIFFFWRRSS